MNDIEKIRSLAKAVQNATTKQEKSIAISDLHDSLNSQVVLDILDRLEAAEKSDAESISMYRKAMDEREALRAEVIYWKEQKEPGAAGWRAIARKVKEENETLRVKLEEIEKERLDLLDELKVKMKVYLVVYGAGLTYSVHGAFLDEVDANTKCIKEARNHYDPDNWRVLEEELVTPKSPPHRRSQRNNDESDS